MKETLSPDDEIRLQAEARAARLMKALTLFREDVRVAFRAAVQLRGGLVDDLSPGEEPCPPMQVDDRP